MPRKLTRKHALALSAAAAALALCLVATFARAPPASAQSPAPVRFSFGADSYRVSEADGGATVTVMRSGAADRAVSVEYLAADTYLMARGCAYLAWVATAAPGADYEKTSGTLTFAPGETSKTFRVRLLDDALVESRNPETVFLSLDFSAEALPDSTACHGAVSTLYIHDDDPAAPPTPTPTPPGKRQIAFASNRGGNYEIYTMDDDGGGQRRLTNSVHGDADPDWSPDGRRIAFVSDRDGKNGIYLMDADGSNVAKLQTGTTDAFEPDWSPDGKRIAFRGTITGAGSNIFVVNTDGTGLVNVTNRGSAEDFGHCWAPDGRRLAFTSRRDNGTFSVYVVNADGTGLRRIVEGYSRDPAWSPDGAKIAYSAQGDQIGSNIYVVNADGTGRKFLSGDRPFAFDTNPSWSSDGARIVFTSNRDGAAAGDYGNYEVYVMNADGTGQTRLTTNAASESNPSFQPNAAPPAPAPRLLTEAGSNWAVAVDSVTFVLDPFSLANTSNFSPDRRTRVALFAADAAAPAPADVSARAEDSAGRLYQLPVEFVTQVPGQAWLTQVVVRLPDELADLDYVWVSLNIRGTVTNKAVIRLQIKR